VLGLACEATPDALNVRMDTDAWRIRIVATGEDDVRTLVPGRCCNRRRHSRAVLERAGVRARGGVRRRPCRARRRRSLVLQRSAVWRVELFTGTRPSGGPFVSPRGARGFVTGAMGFGHVVLMMPDAERADAFFRNGLGMTLSDQITLGPPGRQILLTFLHCNARHHTLAFAPAPAPKRLNHFMVQAVEMDDVGYALDRAAAAGTLMRASEARTIA
jgi:biphenyl-2,3-diol 1,2-dioxygenase